MGEYLEQFDREFLKRTKDILMNSDLVKYNVTLLINCTLALICLPIDNLDRNKNSQVFNDLSSKIVDLGVITENKSDNITDFEILLCLRNGIAHLNMQAINGINKISGVKIEGSTGRGKKKCLCTFCFTKKQLKDFSIYTAKKYLNMIS